MDVIHRIARYRFMAGFLLLAAAPLPAAAAGSTSGAASSVTLEWTAPGDDGMTGRATRYDIRYWTLPLTETFFPLAITVPGVPTPANPGTLQSMTISGLTPGTTYYFALKTVDDAGNWSSMSNVVIRPAQTAEVAGIPTPVELSNGWPNPARQSTRWSYNLPRPSRIQMDAFDVSGRHLRTIASGTYESGTGEIEWDLRDGVGSRVEPGIYLVRARVADQTWTRRVTVVR